MALLPQLLRSPNPSPPSLPFLNAKSPSPHSGISPRPGPPRRRRLLLRRPCSSASPELSPSSSSAADDLVELPLFPLPLVLFPGAILPLQIFEFRYRIMMHTLLHTDLRFGVVFSEPGGGAGAGAVAEVGCVGEVVKHERLVDDRFFLICKGQERFRVSRVVRTKPYLVAAVTWLEDRPPPPDPSAAAPQRTDDLEALAAEVEGYMRDVIRISNRLNGKPEKEEEAASMDLRRNLFPTPFSFFVASTFEGAPREQQALLELEDTAARLRRERDTLRNTLNYLTAASAVKDAFPSSSSSSS
ncbi:Lon protease 2 [Ananas comosus]|uniref:Lon protease 2 n=1 Tax=Ananas comosus TaxID=4615 RepID=A0A199W951_ANACO|nr:Lon protease 2 [Ananas comosus]